ncbi:Insulin-induced protein 2 protein [Podochytrium sp. JEL0797]|nr:Insulin-induced protein 2 protein [Podochytrium sp. JEL0797]
MILHASLRTLILFASGFLLSLLIDNLHQSNIPFHGHFVASSSPSSSKPHSSPAASTSTPFQNQVVSSRDQVQNYHHYNHHRYNNLHTSITSIPIWIPISFGFTAVVIGYLYPLLDRWLHTRAARPELSTVVRLIGGVMGVNYAASKLDFASALQENGAVCLLSLGLWFLFDSTRHGFLVSSLVAGVGAGVKVEAGAGSLFLMSVCFGEIGRLLEGIKV